MHYYCSPLYDWNNNPETWRTFGNCLSSKKLTNLSETFTAVLKVFSRETTSEAIARVTSKGEVKRKLENIAPSRSSGLRKQKQIISVAKCTPCSRKEPFSTDNSSAASSINTSLGSKIKVVVGYFQIEIVISPDLILKSTWEWVDRPDSSGLMDP